MSNTIRNFLVGIGYNYDRQGEQNVTGGIDSIKGKVLQLGAVVAGGFGLKELTLGFANAKDELGKFSDSLDVVPSDVNALGQALEHNGGSLQSFMGQLESLTAMRDGLLAGDAGFIGELGKFGIDASVITDAKNATEAYILLADQIANVSKEQARGAIGVLGFDKASLALLQNGTDEVRRIMAEERGVRDVTDEMVAEAERFKDASQRTGDLMGGFADDVSMLFMPEINDAMESMNERIKAGRPGARNVLEFAKFGLKHIGGFTDRGSSEKDTGRQSFYDNLNAKLPLPSWWPGADNLSKGTEPMNFKNETSSRQNNSSAKQPIVVNATLTLDGQVIDKKIISVVASEAQTAIDDLTSSVEK